MTVERMLELYLLRSYNSFVNYVTKFDKTKYNKRLVELEDELLKQYVINKDSKE